MCLVNVVQAGAYAVAWEFMVQACAWGYQTGRDLVQEAIDYQERYMQDVLLQAEKTAWMAAGLKLQ